MRACVSIYAQGGHGMSMTELVGHGLIWLMPFNADCLIIKLSGTGAWLGCMREERGREHGQRCGCGRRVQVGAVSIHDYLTLAAQAATNPHYLGAWIV